MSIIMNIWIGLAGGIPIALITFFFKKKNTLFLKYIGVFLVIGFNGICIYIALIKAAILGVDKSNDWAVAYIIGVL